MKTFTINESTGNHSNIVATFDNESEATDLVLELATATTIEQISEDDTLVYEDEFQLQISYYNIEETETDLYTTIQEHGEEPTTYGEDIIDTFYNGNFSQGVQQLKDIYVSAHDFGDYLESFSEDMGYDNISDFANRHFDCSFFISLGRELN